MAGKLQIGFDGIALIKVLTGGQETNTPQSCRHLVGLPDGRCSYGRGCTEERIPWKIYLIGFIRAFSG